MLHLPMTSIQRRDASPDLGTNGGICVDFNSAVSLRVVACQFRIRNAKARNLRTRRPRNDAFRLQGLILPFAFETAFLFLPEDGNQVEEEPEPGEGSARKATKKTTRCPRPRLISHSSQSHSCHSPRILCEQSEVVKVNININYMIADGDWRWVDG